MSDIPSAFDGIIGYRQEKEELLLLCDAWKNRTKYEALGVSPPAAVLLYGAPGVGKTLFAKAMLASCDLPVFHCRKDRPEGEFVNAIRETFEKAAAAAPAIVFLDDMDKFAEDNFRSDSNKEEFAAIQNCMENVRGKPVFVVATANEILHLPESLLREGRFGKQILFHAPHGADAEAIITHYLQTKKIGIDFPVPMLARILDGKTCAALEEVVNEAGLLAGHEGAARAERRHVIAAILRVQEGCAFPPDAASRTLSHKAWHEAGHAVAALAVGLSVVTVALTEEGGFCNTFQPEPLSLTATELMRKTVIWQAGRAAVKLHLGENDLGNLRDMEQNVMRLQAAVAENCAFGYRYGYDREQYDRRQSSGRVGRVTRKLYAEIARAYRAAYRLLRKNRDLTAAIAGELRAGRVLLEDDLQRLLEKYPLVGAGKLKKGFSF